MSQRSRKKRVRRKELRSSQLLTSKETGQFLQQSRISSKEVPVSNLPMTMSHYADRYRYVLSDLKRSIIIAGSMFLVLILLYLFL